ncbi:MAG: acylneuraminate cytidylyltransferase, partial [Bacteroidetes bacterium]|nr:acylneuraminate cytidylyltransferase [Bacteroidota bacterium]
YKRQIIDRAVETLIKEKADFVCNNYPPTYPEGLDVEVFTREAISMAERESNSNFEREHVTQYFYHNPSDFKICNIRNGEDLSYLRWTIDTETDFAMAKAVYSKLYNSDSAIFHMDDILKLLRRYPEISKMNMDVSRSEMYKSK